MTLHPCGACPYRRDVPSGVWMAEEYEKLPPFDAPTYEQPPAAFFCHQRTGSLCAGWVGCHDMDHSLGLRMAAATGAITMEEYEEALDYVCPIPLFESGTAVRDHGVAKVEEPGDDARRIVAKLSRKLEGR